VVQNPLAPTILPITPQQKMGVPLDKLGISARGSDAAQTPQQILAPTIPSLSL